MTFDNILPRRFTKIDNQARRDHCYLTENDICYFLTEYKAWKPRTVWPANGLIRDCKKGVMPRILEASSALKSSLNADTVDRLTLVPIPPWMNDDDPSYDDHLTRLLQAIRPTPLLDVRELIVHISSFSRSHRGETLSPRDLERVYRIDRDLTVPTPRAIAIVGYILTTGAHFVAAKSILSRQFPNTKIFGLFIARTPKPPLVLTVNSLIRILTEWTNGKTPASTLPRRFTKIDHKARRDHRYLTKDEVCFYLAEYKAWKPRTAWPVNGLIRDFKNRSESALLQTAAAFRPHLVSDALDHLTLVPVPPSTKNGDSRCDDRLTRMLHAIRPKPPLDVRELIVQINSISESRQRGKLSPTDLEQVYRINLAWTSPTPKAIAVVDEVLTTGAHFMAAKSVLSSQFPNTQIFGLFIGRTPKPPSPPPTSASTLPQHFTSIDDRERRDHDFLTKDDTCWFLAEYKAWEHSADWPVNRPIRNFKKGSESAILEVASAFRSGLGEVNSLALDKLILVPVPPSKKKGKASYDDRLTQMLQAIRPSQPLDVRELVFQTKSTRPSRGTRRKKRMSPEEIEKLYRIDRTLTTSKPKIIVIVDDVLTTGAHFKAAKSVLSRQFPKWPIMGLFIARTVHKDAAELTQ